MRFYPLSLSSDAKAYYNNNIYLAGGTIAPKRQKTGLVVSKTISVPLDLLNDVLDEAEIMGKDFSNAVQVLLRTGIAIRKDQRIREEMEQKAIAATLNGGR